MMPNFGVGDLFNWTDGSATAAGMYIERGDIKIKANSILPWFVGDNNFQAASLDDRHDKDFLPDCATARYSVPYHLTVGIGFQRAVPYCLAALYGGQRKPLYVRDGRIVWLEIQFSDRNRRLASLRKFRRNHHRGTDP